MSDIAQQAKQEFRKLMGAYAAFQMAAVLFVISSNIERASVIILLFAISIPSSIAHGWFARPTPEDEKRNPAPVMVASFCLAYLPSIAAISLLLASASVYAAGAFLVTSVFWLIVLLVVRLTPNKVS